MLVIDDEIHILASVAEYFAALGYTVDCALNETAVHALLERFRYAAVITDLRLSTGHRSEGFDIVKSVRRRHSATACIVLTAYGEAENEQEARRCGADAFLQKPTPLYSLAALLARLLDGRSAELAPEGTP